MEFRANKDKYSQGPRQQCRKCDCSDNIDLSAIGNCDRVTGECLRCIDDTAGFNCERCKSGFFGDALAPRMRGDPPNCAPCQCYPFGTHMSQVSQSYITCMVKVKPYGKRRKGMLIIDTGKYF